MDLSILKYCPHCDAPMTPTSYNFCIGENGQCTCCDNNLPEDHKFGELVCSVCSKELTHDDFKDKKATYTNDLIICLECLKAKRILQKDKEIYNCDFCGEELTQLDFLEDNADIRRMLIVCKSCDEKHFKNDKKQIKKEVSSKKSVKNGNVSETQQSLLEAVKSTVQELDEKEESSKVLQRAEPEEVSSVERSEEIEKVSSTRQAPVAQKSVLDRFSKEKTSIQGFDQRAALGCLVVLVILLSAGIAYLLYNQYSGEKNKVNTELTDLIGAVQERQTDLADKLENFSNRLYALEQLEMRRITNPEPEIKNNPEDKTEPNVEEDSDDDDGEIIEVPKISEKMREILNKLESDKATDKLNAIMDISWENYHGATPKLIEIIKNESDKYLRVFAIITLVSFREKDLIPVLKDIVLKEKKSIVTETADQAIIELEKFAR